MESGEQNEHETCRVIVLGRRGADVLLVLTGERHLLPWVEIPRWQRVAENLTATLKHDWGEEVVCLFEPRTEPLPGAGVSNYQALEHLSACAHPKMPTCWVPLSTLCQDSLADAQDYAAIKQVVKVCNKEIGGASAGPFARLGWLGEVRNWIQSVIEPMGFHLNREFRQLNASASFSLIRFATNGPALWFKAVGEPNERECAITMTLAQFFPDYLPTVLASRQDWNGWLSMEVRGKLLSEVQEWRVWEGAAVALAKLQIQSINRTSQILDAGAHDLGSVALSRRIEPFIGAMAQLMKRQIKTSPPVLARKDLSALTDSLRSSLEAMEATGIPETLGHLDLNPGNVIASENRTAFLDWAEAYIGNPFFTFEYLLQHARREFGGDSTIDDRLTQAYCAQWGRVVSPTTITHALDFAPLLAVFAYAVGSDLWKQAPELQNPTTAGYLRSLTRRMHREAKELADRRALCLQ